MFDLRYHVASLVAVFVALIVGGIVLAHSSSKPRVVTIPKADRNATPALIRAAEEVNFHPPRLDGVGAMRELRRRLPASRVIVLTSFADDERLLPAIKAGAAGYLLKNVAPQELARAVRAAHAGEALLDTAVAARLVEAIATPPGEGPPERLTPREREVLALLGRGLSNKRIARELGVAEKTVKTHVSHLLAKLGAADRTEAAVYAVRAGLVGRST